MADTGKQARSGLAGSPFFCVCVPARNEAERLPTLLAALADQDLGMVVPVVIALNNTHDASSAVLDQARNAHRGKLMIQVDEARYPPALAHAGSARRRAMEVGLQVLWHRDDGVLLTTDADARPPADWVSQNLKAIAEGADIVGGRLVIDDREALPDDVIAARSRWDHYWQSVREIEDALDPSIHDPAPRHGDHTGASLAIRSGLYRNVGGVPAIPLGEDRALVSAAVAAGGRLAHPMAVWTRVSPRRDGRAGGGMAQAMSDLHDAVLANETEWVPSRDQWRARASWRRALRREADGAARIGREEPGLPPMVRDTPLTDWTGSA